MNIARLREIADWHRITAVTHERNAAYHRRTNIEAGESSAAATCDRNAQWHRTAANELRELADAVSLNTEGTESTEEKLSRARAWADADARKIKRLCEMLGRADAALTTCGVGKNSPVRVNINSALKTS